jgi:hypothetical protein
LIDWYLLTKYYCHKSKIHKWTRIQKLQSIIFAESWWLRISDILSVISNMHQHWEHWISTSFFLYHYWSIKQSSIFNLANLHQMCSWIHRESHPHYLRLPPKISFLLSLKETCIHVTKDWLLEAKQIRDWKIYITVVYIKWPFYSANSNKTKVSAYSVVPLDIRVFI